MHRFARLELCQTVPVCGVVFSIIQVGFQMANLQFVMEEAFQGKFGDLGEGLESGTKDPSTGW